MLNAVQRDGLATRVLLLSGALDDQSVYRALEQGAAAIITKTAEAGDVVDAIVAVVRGETVLAPELQSIVARQIQMRAKDDRPVLSRREREILERMARGAAVAVGLRQGLIE